MAEEKKELIKIRGANEHNLKNLDVDISGDLQDLLNTSLDSSSMRTRF